MPAHLLSESKITDALVEVPAWNREGAAIRREVAFRDFRDATSFLLRIAFEAEEADHHPDIDIRYRRVTLSLSTHDAGGLTAKDFALARRIDELLGDGRGAE